MTDLRTLLHQQSDDVAQVPVPERLSSVHARINRARTRRRVGAAAGAAALAIVIGAVGMTYLPSTGPTPATQRTFAGHTAPETWVAAGATYVLDHSVTGDRSLTLDLAGSAEPRLIAWASSTGRADVTVSSVDLNADGSTPDHLKHVPATFTTYEYVDPGTPDGSVTVSAAGQVAAVVYRLSTPAPGPSLEGVVIRDDLPGEPLLNSRWGTVGQSALSMTVTAPTRTVVLRQYCWGVPKGYDVHVSANGQELFSTACDTARPPASAADATSLTGSHFAPGSALEMRVWLTRHHQTTPVTLPGVRLGLGAYERPAGIEYAGGWPLPEIVENDGHDWRFLSWNPAADGSNLTLKTPGGDTPVLVEALSDHTGHGDFHAQIEGTSGVGFAVDNGSGSSTIAGIVRGSSSVVRLSFQGQAGPDQIAGLALYERID